MLKIVLTGPPSSGKTTTFLELQKKLPKETFFPEISRDIIKNSIETNSDVLPWKDVNAFNLEVIGQRISNYQEFNPQTLNFYDRGVLDSYAYAKKDQTLNHYISQVAFMLKYDLALFFPFEESIYHTDSERKEEIQEAKDIELELMKAYNDSNIPMFIVEFDTVEKRVESILKQIQRFMN